MSGKKGGFLPCFSKHRDKVYSPNAFYSNKAFVGKLKKFLEAIVDSPDTYALNDAIHPKGGIQKIDPHGNSDDKKLCQQLRWVESEVYRVDYGNTSYRLLFSLDTVNRRCYILALDTNHQTRSGRRH